MPTVTAVGEASPRAQGHAITKWLRECKGKKQSTSNYKIPDRKCNQCDNMNKWYKIAHYFICYLLDRWFRSLRIPDKFYYLGKNCITPHPFALKFSTPCWLMVPPTRGSPSFFATEIGSPLIIDSSTLLSPLLPSHQPDLLSRFDNDYISDPDFLNKITRYFLSPFSSIIVAVLG
jgi:hypothetical protein